MATKCNFVLAVDGSKQSDTAVRLVAKMAHPNDIIFIYSCYVRPSFLTSAEPQEKASQLICDRARAALSHCKNVGTVVEATTDPRKSIADFVESKLATCVVLGTRGLSPIQRFVIGSVSNYVLHHAREGACVVNNWIGHEDRLHYLVCVDGSAHSQRAADYIATRVRKGDQVTLFAAFPAPCRVIDTVSLGDPDSVVAPAVMENPNYDAELDEGNGKAATLIKAIRHNFAAACADNAEADEIRMYDAYEAADDVRTAILKKAAAIQADVIVMGCRGEGNASRMVFGSVSNYVINHVQEAAALVVHPPEYAE